MDPLNTRLRGRATGQRTIAQTTITTTLLRDGDGFALKQATLLTVDGSELRGMYYTILRCNALSKKQHLLHSNSSLHFAASQSRVAIACGANWENQRCLSCASQKTRGAATKNSNSGDRITLSALKQCLSNPGIRKKSFFRINTRRVG